ncbi:MAG: imidazole glycerol phosphate synthase subunit HisH [Victivallaceae bacterium]
MIALIDYNMGNLFSVTQAFKYCGETPRIVTDAAELMKFDAAVLPGVGNFGEGMLRLRESGLAEKVIEFAQTGRPLLGICLGMQMLLGESDEAPGATGLNLIPGKVRRFPEMGLKVPQIGWNDVAFKKESVPLLAGLEDKSFFYFVHSYYVCPDDAGAVIGETEYGVRYASIIGRDNIYGCQFHPEKSQNCGLQIVKNFITLSRG